MALSLSCRFICVLITQQFDLVCFAAISVVMTRRSLGAFIEISEHSRVRPEIQVVTLRRFRAFPKGLTVLIPNNSSILEDGDHGKAKAPDDVVRPSSERYNEELELEQPGDAAKPLTKAFMSLRDYDRSL
jgi:hypothetical protein